MGNLLLSVLANILGTLIEYGIIKPKFETIWNPLLSRPGSRDWATAVKTSIQKLQSTQGGHVLPFGEHYRLEDVHIEKGKGTITLVVLPKSALVFAYTGLSFIIDALRIDEFPNVIARYQIIIDRSGDILDVKSLSVHQNERYRPLYSREPRFARFPDFSRASISPPKELVLKIKKPIKEIASGELKIQIDFTVENWGETKTIYPYIKYKVAEFNSYGKFDEKIIISPSDWKFDLKAFSSAPVSFIRRFPVGTQLLATGKNSVYVRLYEKPWKNTI